MQFHNYVQETSKEIMLISKASKQKINSNWREDCEASTANGMDVIRDLSWALCARATKPQLSRVFRLRRSLVARARLRFIHESLAEREAVCFVARRRESIERDVFLFINKQKM